MAYVTPKDNWVVEDVPVPSDFNRIEGNAKANHEDIIAEATARDAAILVETNARIAADASFPFPKNSAGVGQWVNVSITYIGPNNYQFILPAGGNWAYFIPTNTGVYASAGVAAGSSSVYQGSSSPLVPMLCWRIS